MAGKKKLFATKEQLEELYNQHKSAYKIAEICNVNYKTVYRLMKHYGIDTTVGSQGARKNNLNHDYFQEIDTPEKAYWLGFLMADGCIYKGSDKYSLRLQINLKADDKDHLDKFQHAIGSSYKMQIKEYNGSQIAVLKVNSTKMCKDLIAHGVTPRKSVVCQYPNIEYDSHFIRGYFDGDGSIKYTSTTGKWNFNIVGGDEMLEAIQDKLPVKTNLYKIKHSIAVSLETSNHEYIAKLFEWLYKDATVKLDRKYKRYEYFYSNYSLSPSGVILMPKVT